VKYCGRCGSLTNRRIPDGDHLPRLICDACGTVHYENPTLVVGCVPEHEGRILLCRRAIEPRRGYWTLPAGFIEFGETLEAGAARECWEEALAKVEIEGLLAVVSIPEIHQVLMFFRARLPVAQFGAGTESLDARLVLPEEIPWDEMAFSSSRFVLERYLADRAAGRCEVHITTLAVGWPD
jgi:ADP-ribose pyrophosphatase YjhB (NUDIX family)